MNLKNQRRMAAQILKCGVNRVWVDPTRLEDIEDAITRADIRSLIKSGAIQKRQKKGVSRVRARYHETQKVKGRRRGLGSREGAKYARNPRKALWIQTIRPLRQLLRDLKNTGKIDAKTYRRFYIQAKGGMFKNKAHLVTQLKLSGYLKEA